MKAPSEKHLEDWIVANREYFGSLWHEDEMPQHTVEVSGRLAGGNIIVPFLNKIIRRQMRFPFGIADLVAQTDYSVVAVELKQGVINADTLMQCLRYMHELRQIWAETMYAVAELPERERDQYTYRQLQHIDVGSQPREEVSGMVVGHSIQNNNILAVAAIANVEVFTYEYDHEQDMYWFERQSIEQVANYQSYEDYRYGAIGESMREIMRRKASWERERGW